MIFPCNNNVALDCLCQNAYFDCRTLGTMRQGDKFLAGPDRCIVLVARCKARVVDLPCSCHICGLTLISSPHLARSYHHLFPVKAFTEVPQAELDTLKVSRPPRSSHPSMHASMLSQCPHVPGCDIKHVELHWGW